MPLIIPESYHHFNMLALDPGINTTGVAVYRVDTRTGAPVDIQAYTLTTDRLFNMAGLDPEAVQERTIKLWKLRDSIIFQLQATMPSIVASEAPFYNKLAPMAYPSLLEVVNMVHTAVLIHNPYVPFHILPPQTVKKALGVAGIKGKEIIAEAVSKRSSIMQVLSTPLSTLDEHSIDAIAVGYAMLRYNLYPGSVL